MIQIVRKLPTEFTFLGEKPSKSMPESIGKLSNVNLPFALQFNYIHFVLNLVIDKLKDALLILNLFYQRYRKFYAFHKNSRS
jgi:hypothetical protein